MSQSNNSLIKFSGILKGLIVSLLLLLISSLIVGSIMAFSNIGEELSAKVLFILNYLSIFTGGAVASYSAKHNGWLNGGLVGLFYMIVIILVGSLWNPIVFSVDLLIRITIGFLLAALGGIIGINII